MTRTQAMHHYLEASARSPSPTAAPTSATPPTSTCRSSSCCAASSPTSASARSTRRTRRPSRSPPGSPDGSYDTDCDGTDDAGAVRSRPARACRRRTSRSPTSWGNVVSYTLTIEQTGGSAMVGARPRLPAQQRAHRLQLHATPVGRDDPNAPAPGKRPRSSMAPTIVLDERRAGPGARLAGRVDDHHDRPADPARPARPRHDAAAGDRRRRAPRQRNTAAVQAEPAFDPDAAALMALGHTFVAPPPPGRSALRPASSSCGRAAARSRRAGAPRRRQRRGGRALVRALFVRPGPCAVLWTACDTSRATARRTISCCCPTSSASST